jgi:hypothetical protein
MDQSAISRIQWTRKARAFSGATIVPAREPTLFDFILLLVAAACQLALGLLGFLVTVRSSKKTQRGRYEVAFVVIGIIGLGAIIWGGARSANVQSGIFDGIQKIEAQLGISKSDGLLSSETIARLNEFSREAAAIGHRPIPTDLTEDKKIAYVDKFEEDVNRWAQSTGDWIQQNMGEDAANKFWDNKNDTFPQYPGLLNAKHNAEMAYLFNRKRNLDAWIP